MRLLLFTLIFASACTLSRKGITKADPKDLRPPPLACAAGFVSVYCNGQNTCAAAGSEASACVSNR